MPQEIVIPVQPTFSELLVAAIAREKATGIEICTSCARDMDFPSSHHIHHPVRYVGGAYYVEGGGQTCATCAAKEKLPKDDPYGPPGFARSHTGGKIKSSLDIYAESRMHPFFKK